MDDLPKAPDNRFVTFCEAERYTQIMGNTIRSGCGHDIIEGDDERRSF
jgi:hypothetical protein